MRIKPLFQVIAPGILVAATGVGAGDLATAAFSGSQLGVGILWAVLLGAALKYSLSEGVARWQLVTGTTLLEGVGQHLGRALPLIFLPYLVAWSFFVGSALMSACAVAAQALLDPFDLHVTTPLLGALHSLLGAALVLKGSFRSFERVMALCIGAMFVVVSVTAVCLWPGASPFFEGLLTPRIEQLQGEDAGWTIALIGGVGGTLTLLCYGYWIEECGRKGVKELGVCRLDLGVGYLVTAFFGLAMVVIGSRVPALGQGATLVASLGLELEKALGPLGRWAFLIGAWGTIFSSLLGVWQAIPSIFSDTWQIWRDPDHPRELSTKRKSYRMFLLFLASVPLAGLQFSFRELQKSYAIVGAAFLPLLGMALLLLCRTRFLGPHGSGRLGKATLILSLAFFLLVFLQRALIH